MSVVADTIRFSVVVPAFNEGHSLSATLRSLQQQDFTGRFEVIVVDNNSSDDTAAIAQRHGARLLSERRPGVCAARQCGTAAAGGEIVVSTDADTVHPRDWLTRLDDQFRRVECAVAVAGPCRYQDPPLWVALFAWLGFDGVAGLFMLSGRVCYLTATNVAFRREGFPGYDQILTQGGDEIDLLRRLQSRGRIVWDAANPVLTSARRLERGLVYTFVVSFGYYYALSYLLNRMLSRMVIGPAPAIRASQVDAPTQAGRSRSRGARMDKQHALLGIYLNDHLTGATGGVELFRRATGSAQGPAKPVLEQLTAEVEQDRQSLRALMQSLKIPIQRYKLAAGWVAEKAGRFKPNGHLLSRSPLSDLTELEGLLLGVQGKAAGWRAIRHLAAGDSRLDSADLDRLIERAERQAETLEQLRLQAVTRVFASS